MKRFSVVWLTLLLASCAQQAVVQSPAELRGTHGFVHVSMPAGGSPVRLKSLASGEEHRLVAQPEHGATAFGLWVPEGQYQLRQLTDVSNQLFQFSDVVNPDDTPYLPISVSRGRMTDMGGLVRMEIGGYESVLLPIRHAEIAAEAQQAAEKLRPHLAAAQPIEWRPATPPRAERQRTGPTNLGLIADMLLEYDRLVNQPPLNVQLKQSKTIDEFFHRAVAVMPPQTDEPASDSAGNLYYGAELGQVRIRSRDGRWTSLDTGTLQAITAVEVHGRKLVAGTARGEIRVSDDERKTWRTTVSLAREESVLDIDRIGSRWMVLTARLAVQAGPAATIQTTDLIKVYSATSDDLSGLAPVREIALSDRMFVVRGMGVRGQSAGNVYYLTSVSELLKLDLATMQWSTATNPGHGITGFNIAPATGMLTAYRQQGLFSKLNLSADQGATWKPAETPPYVFYDIIFETATKGLATRWSTGAFSATIEFLQYDAAANTWRKTHDAPPGCVRLLRDASNVQRFCVSSGNSILNHVDGKWIVEAAVN